MISIKPFLIEFFLTSISNNYPTKLAISITFFDHVSYFVFCALVNKIRLGKNFQSPFFLWINLSGEVYDFLGSNVHIRGYNSQHYGPGIVHVLENHISDQISVLDCSAPRRWGSENSGNVNNTEVVFVRATNLQFQDTA